MTTAIVGAGIAGLALTGAVLLERPDEPVMLIDDPTTAASSDIPAALCHPLTGWSMQRWTERIQDFRASVAWLGEVCDDDLWLRRTLIRPLPDDTRGHRLKRSFDREATSDVAFLAAEAFAERYPEIAGAERGALAFPEAACIDVKQLCSRLLKRLTDCGVTLIRGKVHTIDPGQLVLADGKRLTPTHIALCGGAHSARLLPCLGAERRYFGEILILEGPPLGAFVSAGCHLASTPDGHTALGATWLSESESTDPAIRAAARHALLARARALVPQMADHTVIAHWGGTRVAFERQGARDPLWVSPDGTMVALTGFGATGLSRVWPWAKRAAAVLVG